MRNILEEEERYEQNKDLEKVDKEELNLIKNSEQNRLEIAKKLIENSDYNNIFTALKMNIIYATYRKDGEDLLMDIGFYKNSELSNSNLEKCIIQIWLMLIFDKLNKPISLEIKTSVLNNKIVTTQKIKINENIKNYLELFRFSIEECEQNKWPVTVNKQDIYFLPEV